MSFDLDLKFSNHPRVGSGGKRDREKGMGNRGRGIEEGEWGKREEGGGKRGRWRDI